ncbi:MAG: NADH-quinone oxidoreductase subunit G [Coxiellaceae bacterium]|nr:NADH-quinone oxidoreductase subunit G [Coxiellaceae bacterium]
MIEIEIDGKKCLAEPGQMIIDVADNNDIYIPRFCYHRKLSIAANCRMCLVQVEKMGKPVPACATPVADGIKVFTKSKMAQEAQRAVMEFLLINHPLDCPICDQGGECELQDLAVGFGDDISRYTEGKRSVDDEDLGPLVATDMTRCIHCTRCVRFGEEVAGLRELGATSRGEKMRIGTYVKKAMVSEVSGNVIDLCPVGALTNKPFRFKGRAWEMTQHAMIAPHDCVGSNIYVHTRGYEYTDYREVMRVVPRDHEQVNENWISDRDRYSCEALSSDFRVESPMIKQDGHWVPVDWKTALNTVVDRLRTIQGTDIAGLASPNNTVEELYLLQKLLRGIGCPNIDHRLREHDFSQQEAMPIAPSMQISLDDLESLDAVLLVGSNVRHEQPIINLRLRKAMIESGQAFALNPCEYDFNYPVWQDVAAGDEMITHLATLAKAVALARNETLAPEIEKLAGEVDEFESAFARAIVNADKAAIFFGAYALHHPNAHTLMAIANSIHPVSVLSDGANGAGAWLAGMLPHRGPAADKPEKQGHHARDMFAKQHRAYVLMNVEPELDCADSATALNALNNAEFIVCLTPFRGGAKEDYADVILPIAGFAQTSGTYINAETRWQSFLAAGAPYADARPGWKVLRVLANLFELPGFEFDSSQDVLAELQSLCEDVPSIKTTLKVAPTELRSNLHMQWPMFCVDNVTRRSAPLQATLSDNIAAFRMNSTTAASHHLSAGDKVEAEQKGMYLTLPLVIDESIADGMIHLYCGLNETAAFGSMSQPVNITKGEQ